MLLTSLKIMLTVIAGFIIGITGISYLDKHDTPIPTVESVMPHESGKFSAMVRLVTQDGKFFCSGVVIAEDLVLTAGHCLSREYVGVQSLMNSDMKYIVRPAMPIMVNQRADYGLVTGDFRQFSKLDIQTDPSKDIFYFPSKYVACGNPWGSTPVCYPITSKLVKSYDMFQTTGQLYPGMSGGPVIDLNSGKVVAVNSAVGEGGIRIAPLIGLFESIGR